MIGDNSLGTDNLSGPSFQNVIKSAERPDICFLARDIIAELKEKKNGYKAAVRALVWALMVKLRRIKPPEPENEWRTDRKKLALITPALRHISENYSGTLEMDKLARLCGCGVSNFRKLFHSAAGCSPAAYIKKLKMSVASALVKNTAKPMLEIAAAAGFPTVSNFNRQFRDYFGVPPREMRRRSG
jgi:transcriptional regulator GlxA family with amidase domain